MDNPRAGGSYAGIDMFRYPLTQYVQLLKALVFPADVMADASTMFSSGQYTSCFGYLPLFGITLTVVFLFNSIKSWLSRIIIACIIIAFIPILNSAFYAFTATANLRWFYMPILMFSLATIIMLEKRKKVSFNRGWILSGILVAFIILYSCLAPAEGILFGSVKHLRMFWAYTSIAIAGFVLTFLFFKTRIFDKHFISWIALSVIGFSVVTGGFNIYIQQSQVKDTQSSSQVYNYVVKRALNLKLPDDKNYRIRMLDSIADNFPMVNGTPSVNSFTSTVNGSVFEFYKGLGLDRVIYSNPAYEGISQLLSVKYYITSHKSDNLDELVSYNDGDRITYVYPIRNFIPIGFTYQYYITEEQFLNLEPEVRALALLKAVVLSDEEFTIVEDSLSPLPEDQWNLLISDPSSEMVADIQQRQAESSYFFDRGNEGFVSKINASDNKYAYFSVPYDQGWSATVNGIPVEIINTNGMMLIPVSQGDNFIQFSYFPPGLKFGFVISLVCAGLLTFYIIIVHTKQRR